MNFNYNLILLLHLNGTFYVILVHNQGTSSCLEGISDWYSAGLPVIIWTDGKKLKINLRKIGNQIYRGYAIVYIAYGESFGVFFVS